MDLHDVTAWSELIDTPVILEREHIENGDCWLITALAGLQYYSYCRADGLDGEVLPKAGDRLNPVREPENASDSNAIGVIWRNEHMLGHVPRQVAADIAPLMDRNVPLRAYVLNPGDGSPWSLTALLVGEAVKARHEKRIEYDAEITARSLWGRKPPTPEQQEAATAYEARRQMAGKQREVSAVYAFAQMPEDEEGRLHADCFQEPDPTVLGKSFRNWQQVPPWLMTKTSLSRHGLKLPTGTRPFAVIHSGFRAEAYPLYVVKEAEPLLRSLKRVAAGRALGVMRRKQCLEGESQYLYRTPRNSDNGFNYPFSCCDLPVMLAT